MKNLLDVFFMYEVIEWIKFIIYKVYLYINKNFEIVWWILVCYNLEII